VPFGNPAQYYPFVYDHGRYEVKAGLYPIETEFGNGTADRLVFQCDSLYDAYVDAKRAVRVAAEAGPPIMLASVDSGGRPEVRRHAHEYMCRQLEHEHHVVAPALDGYGLDELAMHLQEDVALVELEPDGATRLAYLHVSLPSGWSPWTKGGKAFPQVHKPVPGIASIDGDALMKEVIERGQIRVRFVWGLQFDDRLDQHPKRGRGRAFDAAAGLWLRIERQVLVGLPAVRAMLFLIHPFVRPVAEVLADPAKGAALVGAVESMSDDQLRYKGLRRDRSEILAFLRTGVGA